MSRYAKKHTRSKNWTQEEYDTVLQMDLEGYTQQEIADHIGRTKSSVKYKMYTLQYRMDKAAITKDHRFEPGAVYLISENETPQCVVFLPNKFIYEGKIQGRKEKHIFRSINGEYLLTFTDAQFGGYRFEKEGEDYAERIREMRDAIKEDLLKKGMSREKADKEAKRIAAATWNKKHPKNPITSKPHKKK